MTHPLTLLALAALLLAPAAQAGADCTEADPCVLRVTLDDSGVWFDAPGDHDATVLQHRWYTIDVLNKFKEDHALSLGNRTLAAPGSEGDGPRSRHGPVPFPEAGNLTLRDATANADATVRVEAAAPPEPPEQPDEPDGDDNATQDPPPPGGTGDENPEPPERRKDVPGPSAPLAATTLALAAAATRSRR